LPKFAFPKVACGLSNVSFPTWNVIVFNSDLVADANSALIAQQEKMRSKNAVGLLSGVIRI